jgi:hypothetical protein
VAVVFFEVLIVFKLVILVLLVMTVSHCFYIVLPTTRPFLCHRNTCTKEGNYRCYQNNLYKFRFHGILLSVEICPLRRNDFGKGLRKIDHTPVRKEEHPVTDWQRPTFGMQWVTAQEGFNRQQLTEQKDYDRRV